MNTSTRVRPASGDRPLEKALDQTEIVTKDVRQAAQQVAVVGTVLEQGVPREAQVGDVAQAIAQTEVLERKLAESAETLTEVSEALEDEVGRHDDAIQALSAKARAAARQIEDRDDSTSG